MGLPPAWRLTRKLVRTFLIRKRPSFKKEKIEQAERDMIKYSQVMDNTEKADQAYKKMLEL